MSSEKIIVLYERLSREDENLGESYSISNQKKLLEDYCREKGWTRFRHFTDDGISGTTFDRPSFKAMIENRSGIFMIDAGKGFVKDGNKNRLREQDIYRIVTTFNEQITDDPKYARFVPNKEIKDHAQDFHKHQQGQCPPL